MNALSCCPHCHRHYPYHGYRHVKKTCWRCGGTGRINCSPQWNWTYDFTTTCIQNYGHYCPSGCSSCCHCCHQTCPDCGGLGYKYEWEWDWSPCSCLSLPSLPVVEPEETRPRFRTGLGVNKTRSVE